MATVGATQRAAATTLVRKPENLWTSALRRLLRNLAAKNPVDLSAGQWIADYYNASARLGHLRYVEPSRVYADLILRGDADFTRTAAMVAAVVRSQLNLHGANGEERA